VEVLFESRDDPISLGKVTFALPWIENIRVAQTFWDVHVPEAVCVAYASGVYPTVPAAYKAVRLRSEITQLRELKHLICVGTTVEREVARSNVPALWRRIEHHLATIREAQRQGSRMARPLLHGGPAEAEEATERQVAELSDQARLLLGDVPPTDAAVLDRAGVTFPAVGTVYHFRREGDGLRPELLLVPKRLVTGVCLGLRLLALLLIFTFLGRLRLLVVNPREGLLKPLVGGVLTAVLLLLFTVDLALAGAAVIAFVGLLRCRAGRAQPA
jgi:hypothetical protein